MVVGDLGVPDHRNSEGQMVGQVVVGAPGVPDHRTSEGQVVVGDQGVPGLLPPDSTSSSCGL